ncbi:MAG: hypothetical protein V4443_11540 [Pseudomonadota bacterium]
MPRHAFHRLPPTTQLLVDGGDARIALNHENLNQYGCAPCPDPELVALGSSTASGVSAAGYAAADTLRNKLVHALTAEPDTVIYTRELQRMRRELLDLCELSSLHGLEVVFAASGTDLHLIAAQLASTAGSATLAVMVESSETGRGVPTALSQRHFSTRTALGAYVAEGDPILPAEPGNNITVVAVPIRLADGSPRPRDEVDQEFAARADGAASLGQRVLLVLTDVSKTGLIAPSPSCVLSLQQKWPDLIDVLVDACQFRIAAATLRAYLKQGFMVALTGSKFIGGPTFSGALFLPTQAVPGARDRALPYILADYSTRGDWPQNWNTSNLAASVNFGLLLRWEAALHELRALRAVAEADVHHFLREFSFEVSRHLMSSPVFQTLPVPALTRTPFIGGSCWDQTQTIFPFLLVNSAQAGAAPLNREQTTQIYRALQLNRTDANTSPVRYQLGQPVACGHRDGIPVSALRLSVSARMVVKAAQDRSSKSAVIARALAALDQIAQLVLSGQYQR